MSFFVQVHHAKQITRDADGHEISCRLGEKIAGFDSPKKLEGYVRENILAFKNDRTVFTGSAFMLTSVHAFIANELKKASLL